MATCRASRTSDALAGDKRIVGSLPADEILELETALGITLELRGRARGPEEVWGHDPVLVSPRCFGAGPRSFPCERWLSEPHEILFLEVEGAEEYHFELSGLQDYEFASADSKHLACESWPSFGGHGVCKIPWPQGWYLPEDGRSVQLTLRVQAGSRLRASGSPAILSRLPPSERQRLLDALAIGKQASEAFTEPWLHRTFQQWGLVAELHASLARGSSHTLASRLMLAKTFLLLGAPRPARYHFNQLTQDSPPESNVFEAIRAEAEVGLAWIALDLDQPEVARIHAMRAARIYRRIGSSSGLTAVARLDAALRESTSTP